MREKHSYTDVQVHPADTYTPVTLQEETFRSKGPRIVYSRRRDRFILAAYLILLNVYMVSIRSGDTPQSALFCPGSEIMFLLIPFMISYSSAIIEVNDCLVSHPQNARIVNEKLHTVIII